MGWTTRIQLCRGRPLDADERDRLAAHVRRFKLSRRSESYGFAVAPADAPGGVIALAGGKFGRSADPDEDADTARLFAALTELRTLFSDALIEVADDLRLVGWDGERYGLVQDPDQELTEVPRDRASWIPVPPPTPPRERKPAAAPKKAVKKAAPVDAALAELAEGRPPVGSDEELRELALLVFAAVKRADKAGERADVDRLRALMEEMPAHVLADAGLESRWLVNGWIAKPVGAAVGALENLDAVRDRILAMWLGSRRDDEALRNQMGYHVMKPAVRDPKVLTALGEAYLRADLDEERHRLWFATEQVFAESATGLPYLIARRRADRSVEKPPRAATRTVHVIAKAKRRESVPTLCIDLATRRPDRDMLLSALGRIDHPHVLPLLERALATDQYTRPVTKALLGVADARTEELLEGLLAHLDPFVRICAAQGLVARRGATAVPLLLAAAAYSKAFGIWRDQPPGNWPNTFSELAKVLEPIQQVSNAPWPQGLTIDAIPDVAESDVPSLPARMASTNPDLRRDAIELAHVDALRARDISRLRMLLDAERWHDAQCKEAGLPMETGEGFTSRVSVVNYWPRWRKLAQIPFDPGERYRWVTWNWLDENIDKLAPQVMPDELTAATSNAGSRRLMFSRSELDQWNEEERAFIESHLP